VRRILVLLLLVLAFPTTALADSPPQLGPGALHRYVDSTTTTHWVTTGASGAGYAYETTLGYLATGGGAGMTALYSCLAGADDHFLSADAGCEGQAGLGRIGFLWGSPPADRASVPIYRCVVPGRGDHFASSDAGCEGQHTEGLLGYAASYGEPLLRFFVPGTGTHVVTAGAVGAGATFEFDLGYLLPGDGGAGTHAIYDCLNTGADRFLSLDPACEGRTVLGREGYAYDQPPTTVPTVAVYRCQWPGHDHFASSAADCEGQNSEGLLGYLRSDGDALNLYGTGAGAQWATPGIVTAGWQYERTLGFLLGSGGPGLQALYGCRTGAGDFFLSLDGTCEGSPVLGRYGFLYSAAPTSEETVAVYRCLRNGTGHFASLDPACEGATTEQRLGYLRTADAGAAPAPSCSPSAARLRASFGKVTSKTVSYGKSAKLSGQALTPSGGPASGVHVSLLEGTGSLVEVGGSTAGANGGFAFTVPPGPNRTLRVAYRAAASDVALACSNAVSLHTRAAVSINASPRRVKAGRTTRFYGRVRGDALPPRGKLVDLQAYEAHKWRTFKTVRTNAKGVYSARYRFRVNATHSFRFRARSRREAAFPYVLGTSRTTSVHVRRK
jgi:hypothetical protein